MKRTIATILFSLVFTLAVVAQAPLAVSVKIPENTALPRSAQQQLVKKMQQLTTLNGVGSQSASARFSLAPLLSIVESGVTPTAPPRQLVRLSLVLILADSTGSKSTLAQVELSAKGVGENEEAAVLNALQQIDIRSATLKRFMEQSKKKIAELPPVTVASPPAAADTL